MTETKRNDYHHVMPLQIRFNDVDKFGHVNNTVYFQFYDTTKTDYIATVCKGVDWERLAIVVVKIEAEFVSQIKGNDHIAGLSVMVLYDLERQQTIPLPDEWRKAISDFEGL